MADFQEQLSLVRTVEQTDDGLSPTLARIDALAQKVLARSWPVQFRIAGSASELTASLQLRYEVAVEQGWAEPQDLPAEQESDAYDPQAVQIVGWDRAVLAATARLVLPELGRGLPTEEAFGLTPQHRPRCVDVGRLCVRRCYRAQPPWVFWGLLCQSWFEMRARGYTGICCSVTASMARIYRALGLGVTALGPPREYWGEKRFPALMLPTASVPDLAFRAVEGVDWRDKGFSGRRGSTIEDATPAAAPRIGSRDPPPQNATGCGAWGV